MKKLIIIALITTCLISETYASEESEEGPAKQQVKILDLSGTELRDDDYASIVNQMKQNRPNHINLSNNPDLSDKAILDEGRIRLHLPFSVTYIDLSGTKIGHDGIKSLITSIPLSTLRLNVHLDDPTINMLVQKGFMKEKHDRWSRKRYVYNS